MLTIYDWHGNYGHPDHIKVHRVGVRAAEMVADELPGLRVFEATINRDADRGDDRRRGRSRARWRSATRTTRSIPTVRPTTAIRSGCRRPSSPTRSTWRTTSVAKRNTIASHRSQVTDTGFFLTMPEEMFASGFRREWFIERGREPGMRPGWLFDE